MFPPTLQKQPSRRAKTQLWISNRGFGEESSFLRCCHDSRLGPSVGNCLTSVKLPNSVENKMILARLKSNATSSGSFSSCRLHEISQTWACNEFLAYSTPHVEIMNLISLCQRKSSLWFHRAFPFRGTIRMFRKNEVRPKRGTCPDMVWEARHPGPFGARVASTSNETASYEQSKDMQRPSLTNASLP